MSPSTKSMPPAATNLPAPPPGYRVLAPVATGGMGAVYKIEHLLTKRIEAMKILPGGLAAESDQIQRFEREIQVQARLSHPNIAALYTAVRDTNSIAIIMEYVEGESLLRMLEAGPLAVPTALDFISQVLGALAYAHAHGVIHRDVAPANIIITRDRVAKLTDFGLARTATDLRLTGSGAPLGSPWYMSPEQVRNVEAVDARTDIYSIAVVLYETITGVKPYQGTSSFSVMRAHVENDPVPPSAHTPTVPSALDAVILKALSKDPSDRFATADQFRAAIQRIIAAPADAAPPLPIPVSRRKQVIAMSVAPIAFVAGFAAVAITHAPKPKPVPAPAPIVSQTPVPAVPAPAGAEPAPVPEVAASPTEPAPVVAPVAAPQTRRAVVAKPATARPSSPIRVSGGEVQSASAAPTSAPSPAGALPDPPTPATAVAPPPVPDALPIAAADTTQAPQKPGNRVVRALGKINPFKKKKD
jgi:serine/threonine protein kinase